MAILGLVPPNRITSELDEQRKRVTKKKIPHEVFCTTASDAKGSKLGLLFLAYSGWLATVSNIFHYFYFDETILPLAFFFSWCNKHIPKKYAGQNKQSDANNFMIAVLNLISFLTRKVIFTYIAYVTACPKSRDFWEKGVTFEVLFREEHPVRCLCIYSQEFDKKAWESLPTWPLKCDNIFRHWSSLKSVNCFYH